jgi:cobalt-zinc-cadmium resistance protein CzcA
MTGPEGQLFWSMSQTYAFSLIGALVLALTFTPVLCTLLLRHVKPVTDNMLVRFLRFR